MEGVAPTLDRACSSTILCGLVLLPGIKSDRGVGDGSSM